MKHASTDASTDLAALPDLQALSGLAPELASTFVSVAADIALVIDAHGIIQHVALGASTQLASLGGLAGVGAPAGAGSALGNTGPWLGRPWVDTVTGGTRRKIELLLAEVQATGITRRREVNHPSGDASDIPVAYSAIRLGAGGPVLAVGRDLRTVAAIQQRFVEATQNMERDYWAQRQQESQVRTLYQLATDAVLMVDAQTLKVVDANPAAQALLAPRLGGSLLGADAAASVLHVERPGFNQLLATARASGSPGVMRAHAAPAALGSAPMALVPVEVSALPLRSGQALRLMVQLRSIDTGHDEAESSRRRAAWVEGLPDALVVTDSSGRVQICNPAFAALCQVADGASARRRTLAELLGDPAHTLAHTVQQARTHGLAHAAQAVTGHTPQDKHSSLALPGHGRPAAAPLLEFEVSAMLLADGDQECIGLRLRKLQPKAYLQPGSAVSEAWPLGAGSGGQLALDTSPVGQLTLAVGRLADEVGLVALPQLLQQATMLAERHLIGSALDRSQGRVQDAALLLGIPMPALQQRMQHLGLTGPSLPR